MKAIGRAVHLWADMVKLPHSVFALPFALMAAFLAGRTRPSGMPSIGQLGLIILCMVGARSVAMTFNRIVDASLDARNPRTSDRPLPSGRLSHRTAWAMLGISAGIFLAGCLGFYLVDGNRWPTWLAVPVLIFICGYSYTKRFTKWSHFYLGLAIALSPVAAWIAVEPGTLGAPALVLMVIVTCWIGGFDIIYSCQDIEVDRRDGLHSLPSRLGPGRALWIARLAHAIVVLGLIVLGRIANLGQVYEAGVFLTAILLLVENGLVKPGDYRKVNVAFFTVNGMVSLLLAAAAIADVMLTADPV